MYACKANEIANSQYCPLREYSFHFYSASGEKNPFIAALLVIMRKFIFGLITRERPIYCFGYLLPATANLYISFQYQHMKLEIIKANNIKLKD